MSSDFGKLWSGLVKQSAAKPVKVCGVPGRAQASPPRRESTAGADPERLLPAGLNSALSLAMRFLGPE